MKFSDLARAARQWGPFAARTVLYGTASCVAGPWTSDHRASLWAMRSWCRSSVRGLDIDVAVSGLEHVPPHGGFVYAANHQSIVDIIVLGSVLPRDFKWAAKRSMFRVPFLGWHLHLAGHVPVDRRAQAAGHVIARFTRVLEEGKGLLVFPEGTRTPDGAMKSFKTGAFHAAARARVPVVPVALHGTFELMRRGALDTGGPGTGRHARTVEVRLGPPLYVHADVEDGRQASDLRRRTQHSVGGLLAAMGGRVDGQAAEAATTG